MKHFVEQGAVFHVSVTRTKVECSRPERPRREMRNPSKTSGGARVQRIDAVILRLPDPGMRFQPFWPATRGKDVYIEKPLAYSVAEGRAMVEAADEPDALSRSARSSEPEATIGRGSN